MNEDEHYKEIYAHFGLAAFKAQCLEEELINFLSLYGLASNRPLSREDVRAMFENHEKLTLGRLLKSALAKVKFAEDIQQTLLQALSKRNELTHGYFANRIELFQTTEDRDKLIKELQDFQQAFDIADQYVQVVTTLMRQVIGLTDDMIYQELVRIFGKENADRMIKTSNWTLQPTPASGRD